MYGSLGSYLVRVSSTRVGLAAILGGLTLAYGLFWFGGISYHPWCYSTSLVLGPPLVALAILVAPYVGGRVRRLALEAWIGGAVPPLVYMLSGSSSVKNLLALLVSERLAMGIAMVLLTPFWFAVLPLALWHDAALSASVQPFGVVSNILFAVESVLSSVVSGLCFVPLLRLAARLQRR